MKKIVHILKAIASRNDILLAALLVSVIFMMVIPLPNIIVDSLIASNMVIAAILLMLSIYIPSPLHLSSFPSILLITTVFRLALAITTTRLILLNADAGHIVYVFGNFVVQGNLIVGTVIFLIITIVQFIVITKGSERVAEVAARFSLDAMPGKQMSIDSDLRAGIIDPNEARKKRETVQQESQMYGAMDGAMKFVKGDAIAGLIIIVVNIIGGVMTGVMQKGMDVQEALSIYTILTIGDGLVSQIPGLFISITAGIVVTRVASEEDSDLGKKIGNQIMSQPDAIVIASGICIMFAIIPGMPYMVFLTFAGILGIGGMLLKKFGVTSSDISSSKSKTPIDKSSNKETENQKVKRLFEFSKNIELKGKDFIPIAPCLLQITDAALKVIIPQALEAALESKRVLQYVKTGVPYPRIAVSVMPSTNAFVNVCIYESVKSSLMIDADKAIIDIKGVNLAINGIASEKIADSFEPELEYYLISLEDLSRAIDIGCTHVQYSVAIASHFCYIMGKFNDKFIGIQECFELLERAKRTFPELVQGCIRVIKVEKIAEILRRLVSEDISIRNVRIILEAIIEWGNKERDTVLLTEYIRSSLAEEITDKYSSNNTISAYVTGIDFEKLIGDATRHTSTGSYLALSPQDSQKIGESVKSELEDSANPILISSLDTRRFLKKLLERFIPALTVLSFNDISPGINIQPIKTINPTLQSQVGGI